MGVLGGWTIYLVGGSFGAKGSGGSTVSTIPQTTVAHVQEGVWPVISFPSMGPPGQSLPRQWVAVEGALASLVGRRSVAEGKSGFWANLGLVHGSPRDIWPLVIHALPAAGIGVALLLNSTAFCDKLTHTHKRVFIVDIVCMVAAVVVSVLMH